MKTCPVCQHTYPDDVESCPHDGTPLAAEVREERECPYCAERILRKARVCKHCGRDVEPLAGTDITAQAPTPATPQRIAETPTARPRESEPGAAASRWLSLTLLSPVVSPQASKPAAVKPPQFQVVTKSSSLVKYVAGDGMVLFFLGVVLLTVIAGGVWYVSEPAENEAITKTGPDLTVTDWQWPTVEYASRYIVGTVRNNSDKEFSSVFVEFNLYDSNGTQVGDAGDVVTNLEAHGTWKFKAHVSEGGAVTARLKDLQGYSRYR